jgi:putative intracellular protease/amidase
VSVVPAPLAPPRLRIAIPVFDGLTALDAIGPYEVLSRLPGASVTFLAGGGSEPGRAIRTDNGMLGVVADAGLDELPAPDVIVVPGGFGTRALLEDEALLGWLRTADATSLWTTSVCTGSLLLGAAGLLDGVEATTHWLELETLRGFGAVPVSRRVVRVGKLITAAGVSAGIDMALSLAALIADEWTARAIALGMEYDPQPPFAGGSVATSSPELVEFVRARRSSLA